MTRINSLSFDMSLFRTTVKCYLLLSAVLSAVVSLNPQTCRECILSKTCRPPACSCCNDNMPIISRNNTPQMVFFTFDDAITPTVASFYRDLFDANRTNPNGCPIKMTLFVSHANTIYSLVNEFYRRGMEIGAHSVSHGHMNRWTFKSEAKKQKENIAKKAGVPLSEIKGWRSPFLEPIGDQQPKSLNELDYTYDATLTISKKGLVKPPIPFTLDYGWPYDCKIKPCPASSHKGFWEVPVISVMDHLERFDCVYVDGCHTPPPNEDTAFKFLWDNFNTYYSGNRAPFGMNMHASWFYYPDRLRAMDRFIKVLGNLPDVYIVSVSQVIDWLKNPTPVSDIHNFKPWGCKNPKITSHHHQRKMQVTRMNTATSVNRVNVLRNNAEQQRKLRIQQARISFLQRQRQRQLEQQKLLQQHGTVNSQNRFNQQPNTVQKQSKLPFTTGTLGHQQYRWLQRQRSRSHFNPRKQTSLTRPRMTWQRALRHQVMHHVQQREPTTSPKPISLQPAPILLKPTQPSKEQLQKQKEKMLLQRKREQLDKQKRLLEEQRIAEQKVVAEENRLAEKKRQDALMHAAKEQIIKSEHIPKNKKTEITKATSERKSKVHSKQELKELLRFAENNLVQSRLLFGVGKPKNLAELKQSFRKIEQRVEITTNAPMKEITTSTAATTTTTKSTTVTTSPTTSKPQQQQQMTITKESVNSHNFLFDSFQDVVGNNKELWTWAIPTKRQSKKVVKTQSTLPPIKVATTGGFIDFNPTTVYSSIRTAAKDKKTIQKPLSNQQSTVAPMFKAKSVQYSIPEEATLVESNTGYDISITPLSLGAKMPTMHPVLQREPCKQGITCTLPDCKCLSLNTPGKLKSKDIPQIVYITIDGEINFSGFTKMRSIFSRQRKNPNGCPIGATMFVSPTGSSVRLVDRIHRDNVEIAIKGSGSIDHSNGGSFTTEVDGYRSKLLKSTSFLSNQISGYRGVDFKPLTDSEMQVLYNKSMYDSSMVTKAKVWPFTLDFGWKGKCENGACPKDTYAGVWEVPVIPLTNAKTKESCNYADTCKTQPNTKQDTLNFLLENFNRHYKSKRSPFGLHLSQKWFHWYYHHNLSGLNKFLDHVLQLKDVYIVSVSNLIEWVKRPTVASRLNEFKPWQCA